MELKGDIALLRFKKQDLVVISTGCDCSGSLQKMSKNVVVLPALALKAAS